MEKIDLPKDLESPHNIDYGTMLEMIGDDHELLALDAALFDEFSPLE